MKNTNQILSSEELSQSTYLVFGYPILELSGKYLKNKHTGCFNKILRVNITKGSIHPFIIFEPGTVNDVWTVEEVEKHYESPYIHNKS